MQRRVSDYRAYSPMRSPLRNQPRPLSPIRNSPFRQPAMSPLRARKQEKPSTTPNKHTASNKDFYRSPKHQQYSTEWADGGLKSKTIKSGIGLFQQLVNENKIGSERKENKYADHSVTPFELHDKRKQNEERGSQMILNARQVESIQTLKPNHSGGQGSSKMERVNHMDSTVKIEGLQPKKHAHILDSFGAPKYSHNIENAVFSKLASKVCQIVGQQKPAQKQQIKQQKQAQNEQAPVSSYCKKQNPQISDSFEQILLLINKAHVRNNEGPSQSELSVKNSLVKSQISFNMSPYL